MKKESKMNITGALVRKLRRQRKWTQKEFSRMLRDAGWSKCTRGWLAKVESGEALVRDKDLPYFRALFGEEFSVQFDMLALRENEERRDDVSLRRDIPMFNDCLSLMLVSLVLV
jgi:transcriptional regulator with XRE-family HTH domain